MNIHKTAVTIYINILITVCAIITSCTTNTVYHHYYPIKDDGWARTDTVYYSIPDSMKTGLYETRIGIRHTVNYPYRDLWLSLELPNRLKADTIHLYLVNDRGNWNGNGTAGGYYQYETIGPEFNYTDTSDSLIKIYHIMNGFKLPHISDIGLKIIKK